MIHGGAGDLDHYTDNATPWLDSIINVLECGRNILQQNSSALDTVESCTAMLEDNPLFNAGRGSVLNDQGKIEDDAAIMDGRDLAAGAVGGVSRIRNPVKLARLVLSECEHVMLVGDSALHFATKAGMESITDDYMITDYQRKQYEKVVKDRQLNQCLPLDSDNKYGTVGAVAYDSNGNLAAATSTGGMLYKMHGRIGDSPIIGAGVYADNRSCAVSATGYGEDLMRTVLAKHIADLIEFNDLDTITAVRKGIHYLVNRISGRGGVIVIDKNGYCASGFSTRTMIHGWIEHEGETRCTFTDSLITST